MIPVKRVVFLISYFIGFLGFLSVVRYVSPVFSLIFVLLALAGILNDRREREILPRIALNVISLVVVLTLIFRVSLENIVVPVVETLLVLLGIKFIERKEFRDFMQIYTISVFLLAGSALLTINISFMVFFILLFFSTVLAIILLTYYSQDPALVFTRDEFKKIVMRALLIPAVALPMTALLFVVLPRTQQPVFSFLSGGMAGTTGFSDSVGIGDVSDIQESESVAMRIRSDKKLSASVYIRGVVLNHFNGKVWTRRLPVEEKEVVKNRAVPVYQEVILEPTGSRYIPAVDVPLSINGQGIKRESDFVFTSPRTITSRIKYSAVSLPDGRIYSERLWKEFYLQIPPGLGSEIYSLAQKLKGSDDRETVKNVVEYVKKNYRYTLEDLPVSDSPLEDFLFRSKKGNCEYFASAAAVLLRVNGIPVRLVAGYKGVEYNQIGDYYIVPQKYAHTWIEVNIDGYWERFDPTGISSSEIFAGKERTFMEKLKLFMDAVEYAYINSIINFDFKKQVEIVRSAGSFLSGIRGLGEIIKEKAIFVLIPVIFVVLLYFIGKIKIKDPYERLLSKFYRKMNKYGYVKRPNEGLEEFVDRIGDVQLKQRAIRFVKEFERYYYTDREPDGEVYKILSRLVDDI
ncbi:transglutaminase family protein [Persephonella sp.]